MKKIYSFLVFLSLNLYAITKEELAQKQSEYVSEVEKLIQDLPPEIKQANIEQYEVADLIFSNPKYEKFRDSVRPVLVIVPGGGVFTGTWSFMEGAILSCKGYEYQPPGKWIINLDDMYTDNLASKSLKLWKNDQGLSQIFTKPVSALGIGIGGVLIPVEYVVQELSSILFNSTYAAGFYTTKGFQLNSNSHKLPMGIVRLIEQGLSKKVKKYLKKEFLKYRFDVEFISL